jgi:hypothetical protein
MSPEAARLNKTQRRGIEYTEISGFCITGDERGGAPGGVCPALQFPCLGIVRNHDLHMSMFFWCIVVWYDTVGDLFIYFSTYCILYSTYCIFFGWFLRAWLPVVTKVVTHRSRCLSTNSSPARLGRVQ